LDFARKAMSTPASSNSGSRPPGYWEAPSLAAMQAMLPQYQFISLLGRGGMGAVYKAVQVSLDRPVAIKVLPGDLIDDTDANFTERFKNEARTMARMNHPAIVNVYDFGETAAGLLYIVMEFIDGTDVAAMISSQGKLPPDYALAITAHVCDALNYAHRNGVIHRDIKPANILINREGAVKVADFGLAKQSDSGLAGLTKSNVAMGTPDFVAPEAFIAGMPLDGRADLYAIGVMLYQMLTGEIPRGMWTMPGLKFGTDRRFDAIIAKAMQTDREARYQSAAEIRQDLDHIMTMPLVQAGGPSSAAIPKQAVAQKPVAKRPPGPQTHKPGYASSEGPATTPKKSRSGMLMAIGFSLVSCIALSFMIPALRKPSGNFPAKAATTASPPAPQLARPASTAPKTVATASPKSLAPKPESTSVSNVRNTSTPNLGTKAVEILSGVDLAHDLVAGEWQKQGGRLYMMRSEGEAKARVELPVVCSGNYQAEVTFTPAPGSGELVLHMPYRKKDGEGAGSLSLRMKLGQGKELRAGFEFLAGQGIESNDNPTLIKAAIPSGRRHRLVARIDLGEGDEIALSLWLNGRHSRWEGTRGQMSGANVAWQPVHRPRFAIGVSVPGTEFSSVRLESFADEMQWLGRPDTSVAKPVLPLSPPIAPSPASPAPDPVSLRLAELEKQFLAAYETQVNAIHKTAMSDLNTKYLAALDRSIAIVSQAGNLDAVVALRDEKTQVKTHGVIPAEDAGNMSPSLKPLRDTYRKTAARFVTNRDTLAAPLYAAYDKALTNYQEELTRAQKLDEASRVKAVRDHVATQQGSESTLATAQPVASPSATLGGIAAVKSSATFVTPTAPLLPADKVQAPPAKATSEEVRALLEWMIQAKGNAIVVVDGVKHRVDSLETMPRGKFALLNFYVPQMAIDDGGKRRLATLGGIPDLEHLVFNNNGGIFPIAEFRGLTKLKFLQIAPGILDDASCAHLAALKNLEKFTLRNCSQFNGAGLGYLNPNLYELTMDSDSLTAAGMAYVSRFKKLGVLGLRGSSSLQDNMLECLSALPELEELDVGATTLDGSFLNYLPADSKIKILWLDRIKGFKTEHLSLLARLKNLEQLSLPPVETTSATMAALASLPKLSLLNFEACTSFTGETFAGLKGFSSLTSLSLTDSPITDAGIEAIANALPALKSLSFERFGNSKATFTPQALATHFSKLRNLTILLALQKGVTDDWLPHIAQLRNITVLSLQGSGITDAGLVHLKKMQIENLRIDQTDVTDASVPVLKSFPKLNYINTASSRMTPQGAEEVRRSFKK
jgi:serine/threonine protein kinase